MDLEFSEEQNMLRDLVRDICRDFSSLEVVRAAENDVRGYPDALWKQLSEAGLCGLLISDKQGGSAQSMLDCAVVYEELGRALAPTPHFESCVFAAGLIARAGSPEQCSEWLPRIASGDAVLVPAWLEPDCGFGAEGIQLAAEASDEGYTLRGSKRHVPFAAAADRLIVPVRTGGGADGVSLLLVDPKTPGITLTQQQSLASDAQFRVDFDGVTVPASARLGDEGFGFATWESSVLEAIIPLSAWAMGGAERALEITVEYAKERHQFGKPIGAFQSISHYLADAATVLDAGRTMVHQAAWAASEGRSIRQLAPMAKLFAGQSYRDITKTCQQIWGGVGFTVEYDIQLYFRRAKQLELSWWDARTLEERIASEIFEPE